MAMFAGSCCLFVLHQFHTPCKTLCRQIRVTPSKVGGGVGVGVGVDPGPQQGPGPSFTTDLMRHGIVAILAATAATIACRVFKLLFDKHFPILRTKNTHCFNRCSQYAFCFLYSQPFALCTFLDPQHSAPACFSICIHDSLRSAPASFL